MRVRKLRWTWRLKEASVGAQMAHVAPQPIGWSASVSSTRSLGVVRPPSGNAMPSTATPLVVAPVAYHARSSRRGRRPNRKPRPSPDDRVEAAVKVIVRRDCPGDTRVGLLGTGVRGALGKWDTSKVALMRRWSKDPAIWEWVLAVPIGAQLSFKLVTVDPGGAVAHWSPGEVISVDVPRGCAGVDVDVDWPVSRGPSGLDPGAPGPARPPVAVRQKVVVEKPLHEYRVETGGAWLAYGAKTTTDGDDDDDIGDDIGGDDGGGGDDDDDDRNIDTADVETDSREGTNARETEDRNASPDADDDGGSALLPPRPVSESAGSARVVVDALDAVDLDAEGAAERDTAGHFTRADASADDGDLDFSADESESDAFGSADASSDDDIKGGPSGETREAASRARSEETREARRAAGYVVGSHLDAMSGGKKTELVVNAADARRRGVRVGVVEDGRLVETWYEDGAGPGEGMRVGDVYLGVVAKVIGGMQGVLVDVTGKGPPYSLMQKGVDEPALAWREADAGYEREMELERTEKEAEARAAREPAALAGPRDDARGGDSDALRLGVEDALAPDARLARLERKAAASAIGSRAGGRWADAWAEGVGVSDSFDGDRDAAGSTSAETVAASLETFAEERADTAEAGVGVATTVAAAAEETEELEETVSSATEASVSPSRVPPPFAWAPWRRGGGAARAAEASASRADAPDEDTDASSASVSSAADEVALESDAAESAETRRSPLTAVERRSGRGVVDDWVPGMPVVVQVTRLGSGHKGPRVTARPTLPGRNVVLCPDGEGVYVSRKLAGAARAYVKAVGSEVAPPDCALIMRTEAAGVSKEVLATDITSLAADWNEVKRRAETAVAASGEHRRSPMPRRLLDAATAEQILVRDLFGERVARLVVDSARARDAIVEDLRKTGATEETIAKVELLEPTTSDATDGGASQAGSADASPRRADEVWDALGLRDAILSTEEERVWLNAERLPGAHLVIQRTEALTAVDVNAGRAAFSADGNTESVAFAVNVAAATELAAQLRLRDVGGLVMIDFIDMTKQKHRRSVEAAFLEAAKHDRAQVTFLPISPLGVMEVARERLQGNHAGRFVVADEKGMPINPDRPAGGPRRVRGPRPPPWARGRASSGGFSDASVEPRTPRGARERGIDDRTGVDARASRGFRGFRDSSRRRERGNRGAVANHSGSFYGGARRGRRGGKARGGQKNFPAGSGDGA